MQRQRHATLPGKLHNVVKQPQRICALVASDVKADTWSNEETIVVSIVRKKKKQNKLGEREREAATTLP